MAELHIPDELITLALEEDILDDVYDSDAEVVADLRRIAAPVVAAELRRLAKLHDAPHVDHEISAIESVAFSTMHSIAQDLRARADEIEREAR